MNKEKIRDDKTETRNTTLNRRNILLGGTTLAAMSALAGGANVAQAQQQPRPATPAPAGGKPNILVIFGDDVGIANISAYSGGLMGFDTVTLQVLACLPKGTACSANSQCCSKKCSKKVCR